MRWLPSNRFARVFLLCVLIAVVTAVVALLVAIAVARPGLAIGIALGLLVIGWGTGRGHPWKIRAEYAIYWLGLSKSTFDVVVHGETLRDVAWSYPDPNPAFRSLLDHVAVYAGPFDGCFVDDEREPGNFYGGWISSDVAGPFKGAPGSSFW